MLQISLFSFLLSLDAFTTSMVYGISKIKIPFFSAIIISLIGVSFLGISFLLSFSLKGIIQTHVASIISCSILCFLGIHNLCSIMIKRYFTQKKLQQKSSSEPPILFTIYCDETYADVDHSSVLSPKESILLAVALSIDSLAAGFSMGLETVPYAWLLLLTFLIHFIFILLGSILGSYFHIKWDLSWLSGLFLIILGLIKLT